jgi:hypothetical protein
MATIAAPGPDIDPANNDVYSYPHAPKAAARGAPTPGGNAREPQTRGGSVNRGGRGGHAVRNFSLAALAVVAGLWAVRRASRRDVSK